MARWQSCAPAVLAAPAAVVLCPCSVGGICTSVLCIVC